MKYAATCALALFVVQAGRLHAQDISLSMILVNGDGWKQVTKEPVPKFPSPKEVSSPLATFQIKGDTIQVRHTTDSNTKIAMLALPGFVEPTCVTLWPDGGQLVIGDKKGAWLWAVRIEADGLFGPSDRYYSLRHNPKKNMPVRAMVMDAGFLLYACTPQGVQVFDPTGRLSGVILPPAKEPLTAINIGGPDGHTLYVLCGSKIYGRRIQGKAAKR